MSDSGEKVAAKKGLSFVSFPKVLTLHLKRFVFDYATMRRRKVNDPLRIGSDLDLRPFLAEDAGKKTRLLRHFILKFIILPRQARDKHRENSKRDAFSYSSSSCCCCRRFTERGRARSEHAV